jgi:hypothetical protein
MAVDGAPETLPTVSARPRVVSDFGQVRGGPDDNYAVAPDGGRLMLQEGENEHEVTRFSVALNLFEGLTRRMPAGTSE